MSKFLIASCLAMAATASADPGYLVGAPALLNAYPNWPGVSTPYSSSTCFGCRPALHYGKRSADAEADAEPGYLAYGYGYPRAYGYGLHAHGLYAHGLGVAGHPGAATSFVARSPQGLGKRSADAEPGYGLYGYGFHGVPLGLPYNGAVHGINRFPQLDTPSNMLPVASVVQMLMPMLMLTMEVMDMVVMDMVIMDMLAMDMLTLDMVTMDMDMAMDMDIMVNQIKLLYHHFEI